VARLVRAWLALLACWLVGCGSLKDWTRLEPPWTAERIAAESELRIVRPNEPTVTMHAPRLVTVDGRESLVGRAPDDPRFEVRVPFDRVVGIEAYQFVPERVAAVIVIVALVVVAVAAVSAGAEFTVGM
jgi:hypothetical protein